MFEKKRALSLRRALWPAVVLMFFASGCADRTLALRQGLAEQSRVVVVYTDGLFVTRVDGMEVATVPTPAAFRSLGRTVRETLARHLKHRLVLEEESSDGQGKTGLDAVVSVHGGYICRGAPPQYDCTLALQVQLTFRRRGSGRIVGYRGNVIGQAWYGRHPIRSEQGEERNSERLRNRIAKEIPPKVLLGPLESATEEGLAVFLEGVRAPVKQSGG